MLYEIKKFPSGEKYILVDKKTRDLEEQLQNEHGHDVSILTIDHLLRRQQRAEQRVKIRLKNMQ